MLLVRIGQAAQCRAQIHPDVGTVVDHATGIFERQARGGDGKLGKSIGPALALFAQEIVGIEIVDLRGKPRAIAGGVEPLEPVDGDPLGQDVTPKSVLADPQRRDHADAGDRDPMLGDHRPTAASAIDFMQWRVRRATPEMK